MVKLQPGQSRFEIPASGEDEANGRTAYTSLVFVRIAEGGGANLRHALHLAPRSQTLTTRRSVARRGSIEAGPAAAMQIPNLQTGTDDLRWSASHPPVYARSPKETLRTIACTRPQSVPIPRSLVRWQSASRSHSTDRPR